MARNNVRRKFEPVFGPEEYTVTTVSKGGVTMRNAEGKERRRHLDDVRVLPSITEEETTPAEEQHLKESNQSQSAQQEEIHHEKRKSGRTRKPNTKIFNSDFETSI